MLHISYMEAVCLTVLFGSVCYFAGQFRQLARKKPTVTP
jgi:hypothetical protein